MIEIFALRRLKMLSTRSPFSWCSSNVPCMRVVCPTMSWWNKIGRRGVRVLLKKCSPSLGIAATSEPVRLRPLVGSELVALLDESTRTRQLTCPAPLTLINAASELLLDTSDTLFAPSSSDSAARSCPFCAAPEPPGRAPSIAAPPPAPPRGGAWPNALRLRGCRDSLSAC